MTHQEAIDKLISVRHFCYQKGILGFGSKKLQNYIPPQSDFRQAFLTLNAFYNQLKHGYSIGRRSERGSRRKVIGEGV